MNLELKGLLIDSTPSLMEPLEGSLKPDIEFEHFEFVNTVHKAIQYHMETDFNVCFIGEAFPSVDLQAFLRDFQKLGKKTPCAFVQVRKKVDLDLDRSSFKSIGFDTVISLAGDHRDKAALWGVLQDVINRRERDETVRNLDAIVDSLMTEVDKTARERKRGAKIKLNNIYGKYVRESSQRFDGLSEEFFDRLLGAIEDAEPFEASAIEVPEDVLAKNLPHLQKDKYKGQSHRVWEKLLNKLAAANTDPSTIAKVSEALIPSETLENQDTEPEGASQEEEEDSVEKISPPGESS